MAIATATTRLTFEEYTKLPPIYGRYDIVDGELIMAPSPFPSHQWYQENIVEHVRPFVRKRKLGVVLSAPCDVVVRVRPLRTRQPDVLYVSKERSGWTSVEDFKDVERLHVAPELVVEILSDSDRRRVLKAKLADYHRIGVLEAWLVDTESEIVTVLRLRPDGDETVGVFSKGETIRSEVLPRLKMTVDQVFA
jgi:Uma2 family endonuclease